MRSHYESVERVITAMRDQLDQPMTLRELAKIGFASPYHFHRTFRQITGVPPLQFLYALRLDAAKRMLTETQKKVIDICYEVGYSSVGTFTRRFAGVLGVSPVRFRKLTGQQTRSTYTSADDAINTQNPNGASLTGYISAPSNFQGVVAVGLFTTRIPQGKPVSCAVIQAKGIYEMENVPKGEFYLFAVGLKKPSDASVYFDYETALRAGGQKIRISRNSVHGSTLLDLRPPTAFDPPLLLVLSAQK
ncbi:MAG TPA: AraC family transcriptional regulator, partial [Candidatus Angelobacter sp.]|nr:AraC family transcriptional regulator [Candidatus Angelobacter sp.]